MFGKNFSRVSKTVSVACTIALVLAAIAAIWQAVDYVRLGLATKVESRHVTDLPSNKERERELAGIPAADGFASGISSGRTVSSNDLAADVTDVNAARSPGHYSDKMQIIDPVLIAHAIQPRDADLIEWFDNWRQKLAANESLTDADRASLQQILSQTKGSALQLFKMGKAFHDLSRDRLTTGPFYIAAIDREHAELAGTTPGSPFACEVLLAGKPANTLLWDLQETGDDHGGVAALHIRYSDSLQYLTEGNPDTDYTRQHGYIGSVECLAIEGKLKESIAFAKSVDTTKMTDAEHSLFAMVYGGVLYANKQYVDAIPQMKISAGDPHFAYQDYSWELLIQLYARSGERAKAEQCCKDYGAVFDAPQTVGNTK